MGKIITLGGERLGSEGKMKEYLHGYGRSSHNIGKIVTTDQAAGTLVPYFCDVATNGTTYYIDIATKVHTLPTVGPLFGLFKHQIDVFSIPIRLYIGALHNNALGIGLKMSEIKLPKVRVNATEGDENKIAQDSLLAYTGIRKMGTALGTGERLWPGIHILAYWDIYKNYYANKQEEIGYVITGSKNKAVNVELQNTEGEELSSSTTDTQTWTNDVKIEGTNYILQITYNNVANENSARQARVLLQELIDWKLEFNEKSQKYIAVPIYHTAKIDLSNEELWSAEQVNDNNPGKTWIFRPRDVKAWTSLEKNKVDNQFYGIYALAEYQALTNELQEGIVLNEFELSNIDKMREAILQTPKTTEFRFPQISNNTFILPYTAHIGNTGGIPIKSLSQTGLGIKTYLSDRFNNWLSTEWIDGTTNGINEITSVDVSDGKLSMDALILSKKMFNMLNRIAVSGGSYNDWQEAVYGVSTIRMAESPMYCGGMSSEIVFDEIVSSSAFEAGGEEQALGTLAGKGTDRGTRGGKSIKVNIEEPSMLMIIGSITPRVTYSQGNKWWTMLDTMDDLHKPELDQIGFQELVTEEFAAEDTQLQNVGGVLIPKFKSVGKQPSWIEYTTNTNESFGDFSANEALEWMVLNRKYHFNNLGELQDATTYIDPTIYNSAFADTKLTAKNFWVQIAFDITARRKMSAKQMPNL